MLHNLGVQLLYFIFSFFLDCHQLWISTFFERWMLTFLSIYIYFETQWFFVTLEQRNVERKRNFLHFNIIFTKMKYFATFRSNETWNANFFYVGQTKRETQQPCFVPVSHVWHLCMSLWLCHHSSVSESKPDLKDDPIRVWHPPPFLSAVMNSAI
jgi:hypothetical protein